MLKEATSFATSALISFVPRQVILVSKSPVAMTEMEMEKKNKRKLKAKPTETLEENGSNAATTLATEGRAKGLVLSSIEAFLGSSGLNKTLAAFRTEARLESNGLEASAINLEELFCRIFGFSEGNEEATIGWLKDLQKAAVSKADGSENAHDASEENQKKKRKTRKKDAEGSKTMTNEHEPENCNNELNGLADANGDKKPKSTAEPCFETKEKKKKKHKVGSDACEEKADCGDSIRTQEIVEEKIGELKSLIDTSTLPVESSAKHKGEKKKKVKATSVSLAGNGNEHNKDDPIESDPVMGKSSVLANGAIDVKKPKSAERSCSETKEKIKKKHKVSSGDCEEKAERAEGKKLQEIVEEKIGELKSLIGTSTLPVESSAKHKGEKKKKVKATSDLLVENGIGHTKDDIKESDSVKEKSSVSVNDDSIEKKSHKKRKRVASEEKEFQGENKIITKELTDAGINAESGTLERLGKSLQESEQTPMGKKRKTEKSSDIQDVQKELADGNVEQEKKEGGTASKSKKRENPSAEPKTVTAFQRVKIDEVKFADDRLQDNSYWALDDTGSGYGAKAQEVLGQVRGRDFRHEKTKKKRGTYRGGQIDLESKSIKFNYADE